MRRYDIISGILLILSIIDSALAASVLVQEKRQASVVVARPPKDGITVSRKRMDEEELARNAKLWEEYFENLAHSEMSDSEPDIYPPSSSHLSQPGHGSTNVAQAPPPPNPPPPTANPHQSDDLYPYKGNDEFHRPLYTPTPSAYASSGYGSDEEFAKAHAPEPNTNPWSSTDSEDSDSSTDPGLDWNYWVNSEDPLAPPPRPASLNEFGQANEHQAENSPSPNLGSKESVTGTHDW